MMSAPPRRDEPPPGVLGSGTSSGGGVSRAGRVVFPFTRGSAGAVPVGSGGTASPPGTLRSGAATVAAQAWAAGSDSSSSRVRAAWASACWPSSQSAISPARAGAGRSGARAASPLRARARIVSSGIPSRSESSP